MSYTLKSVPLKTITPDPRQTRKHFDPDAMAELRGSIEKQGMRIPLIVELLSEGGYIIRDGERRYRVLCDLKATHADCLILERPLTDVGAISLQLVANETRERLTPSECAAAYSMLMTLKGLRTEAELAELLGLEPAIVHKRLSIVRLPDDIRAEVDAGRIPLTSGYELSRVKDPNQQRALADQVIGKQLNRDELSKVVREMGDAKRGKSAGNGKPKSSRWCEFRFGDIVLRISGGTMSELRAALDELGREVRKAESRNWDLKMLVNDLDFRAHVRTPAATMA